MSAVWGVLFDLDGTLIDTRDAILHAYRRTFEQEVGRPMPKELENPHVLMAPRPIEIFRSWVPEGDSLRLAAAYGQFYLAEGYRKARPFPDVVELLTGLDEAGVPFGIVTNKGRPRAEQDLAWVGLRADRFRCVVTAEDSIERKPDPTPIRIGARRAGLDPGVSWYVGDGPQDVLGGRAAGMRTAGAGYGYYGPEALQLHHPDLLLQTPTDLLTGFRAEEGAR